MVQSRSLPPPRRPRRGFRCTAAFTMVEVAMAACVMTFGIASAIIALQAGFKTLDVARGTTLASQLLQSEMENLRLQSWSDIEAKEGTSTVNLTDLLSDQPAAQTVASGYGFVLTRTVQDVVGREGDMMELILRASWRTIDGRTLNRSFRTYYARNGLYDYYYTLARP